MTDIKKPRKPASKAIKVAEQNYDLVIAEALREGVKRGKIVTLQNIIDELIVKHLSGKPKPQLKE